jgi:AcrR family transcriptional regulator
MPTTAPADCPAPDRRVQRTRAALREALLALMVERGWDAIDVQSLCERANVGRSTFYQHFPSKEEMLRENFAAMRDGLLAHAAQGAGQPLGFVLPLLSHVHGNQQAFRALVGRRSGHFVQDRFRELLLELVERSTPAPARQWQAAARAHFLAGALFELMVWWLGRQRPQRPAEVAARFAQWSEAVLAAPLS